MHPVTAQAFSNIALIKYWGNRNEHLRLPENGSISINLDGLETRTSVTFHASRPTDALTINGKQAAGASLQRVSKFLDLIRQMAGMALRAEVASQSNFPAGAGIASSAAAFAALALSGTKAAGLDLDETALSRLARRGSGSACRSIPGGFVEWQMGKGDEDSYATTIAPASHWDLVDCIAIVSSEPKPKGSTEGHARAATSPLQASRVADTPRRLEICRNAIQQRDFATFAEIVELDSDMMHAVMMTSRPALFYWQATTLSILLTVRDSRQKGLPVCYTVDAGPNVHVITEKAHTQAAVDLLQNLPGVWEVRVASIGGPARLV